MEINPMTAKMHVRIPSRRNWKNYYWAGQIGIEDVQSRPIRQVLQCYESESQKGGLWVTRTWVYPCILSIP